MVAVLMLSLPKSYGSLIISLDSHASNGNFDFVVQCCMNKEAHQLSLGSAAEPSLKDSKSTVFYADGGKPKRDRKDVTCCWC
jgi:hypothetical protein